MKRILTLLASGFFWLPLAQAQAQEPIPVPRFRQVDTALKAPQFPAGTEFRLLTDGDFPPFSFVTSEGRPAGIAVDLAQAVCTELRVTCRIVPMAFGELMTALANGQGDAIIAGPRLSPETVQAADPTRPIYRAMGRFAVRRDSAITGTSPAELAGQRIGVVRGAGHAAWLRRYYAKAAITLFDSESGAREALKAGQIDMVFGDTLRLTYWTAGQVSAQCCKLAGAGYIDPLHFSQAMVFLVRRDKPQLREALDYSLDRLQSSGAYAEIVRRYLPANPW